MDYYQLLGVSPDCDRETLHRAFRQLSLKFHPDRYRETARKLAEKRYQKMVVAFNTLKDRKLRARYDKTHNITHPAGSKASGLGTAQVYGSKSPSDSHMGGGISLNQIDPETLARQHFQAGVKKFANGLWPDALEHFNASLTVRKSDPELYFYKGQCEKHIPSAHRQAVASFQKATQLQSKNAKYHVAFIKALISFRLKSRVASAIERALILLPENTEILALDQQCNPEKYKKGIFGSLFGKK